jgi:hypothetical protein
MVSINKENVAKFMSTGKKKVEHNIFEPLAIGIRSIMIVLCHQSKIPICF